MPRRRRNDNGIFGGATQRGGAFGVWNEPRRSSGGMFGGSVPMKNEPRRSPSGIFGGSVPTKRGGIFGVRNEPRRERVEYHHYDRGSDVVEHHHYYHHQNQHRGRPSFLGLSIKNKLLAISIGAIMLIAGIYGSGTIGMWPTLSLWILGIIILYTGIYG